ncbi:MAG: Mur ligase family protein, partial [Candidatus Saccharimonadales bacterium]
MINNLVEANLVLARYIPLTKEITGKDITLERMRPLMDHLGNPERGLCVIHIAGTSGKTSTAYYIASLLKQQGRTVGLTVSPHMDSVTERVQLDMQTLSEADFCMALSEFIDLLDSAPLQPTYFELLTAFAYWYFAKVGVDYAVVETGLGGLYDATNIAHGNNKVCVITDIGYDHMHVLGNTLPEIAAQKAGIIWPHNQVFSYPQPEEIMSVLEAKCLETHSILNVLSIIEHHDGPESLGALPLYQKRNWLLAKYVCDFVVERDGLQKLSSTQISSSIQIQVPGRMEIVKYLGKTIVMDG